MRALLRLLRVILNHHTAYIAPKLSETYLHINVTKSIDKNYTFFNEKIKYLIIVGISMTLERKLQNL